ncbi:MAG: SIMPL domain-containing protein [Candidatus Pacebacteria bacterium]|nr:SIMPL domain-containing protein [Candidatus Paceibacterota bacterium]
MDAKKQKQLINTAIAFLVILSLGVLSWGYYNYHQAQSIINQGEHTISFTAEGKVLAKPDIAKITFYVINQGEKAETVQKENNERMQEAVIFVKNQGVGDDDIRTVQYNLTPEYDYTWCKKPGEKPYPSCPPKIIGYKLNQGIEVKMRDFDKIDTIVGGLSEKGVNQISNVSFVIDDTENYKNEARILALDKVEKRAKLLAQKSSIKLGKIIDISEGQEIYPVYRTATMEAVPTSSDEITAPIEPGTEEITVILTVTYKLR